jgi:hypothetical protein
MNTLGDAKCATRHGEPAATDALRARTAPELGGSVTVPNKLQTVALT